jgi:hypothetical protein
VKRFIEFAGLLAAVALVAGACRRDHGELVEQPRARGGAGGMGGMAGMGGRPRGGSGGGATGGTPSKVREPTGRSVTSFFHGIVDAPRVVFCFARHDEATPELVGDPMPSGGLAYASSFALETIDGIDLETVPVLPYVIAGELELVEGATCEEAVARARDEMAAVEPVALGRGEGGAGGEPGSGGSGGEANPPEPPRLRVAALPEIPAPALAQGYSSLYVADGCLGGPAFAHARAEAACGPGYSPRSPTASATLVTLSRARADGMLALQALHASLASPVLSVSSAPPDTALQPSVFVAYDLHRGVILPRQPQAMLTVTDYGIQSPGWQARASSNGTPVIGERWVEVRERAGIAEVEAGRGYTLVVVGPPGDIGSRGFWNRAAIGLVDNDPE